MTLATSTLIFATLVLVAGFAIIAKWLRLAYPIVFVIGGALFAFIPGLPRIEIQPDLVFFLFLPPLLYAGGIQTEWGDFKRYVTPIITLAVGLVVVTTVVVALVAHALVGLPLAAAFVLGAVVSPPDAVATEAIAHDLPLPRSTKAILSGESLINDATALVIYRFAVAAVASGAISIWQASWQFVYVSAAGIGIGWVGVALLSRILTWLRRRRLVDETVSVLFSLITPFVVYLVAESVHASGVLAAVTAGVVTAQRIARIFDPSSRIAAYGVWSVLTFSLNAVLFMLIGLQLRSVIAALDIYPPLTLLGYGAAISATVVAVRFAWVYPITALRFRFFPRLGSLDTAPPTWQSLFIISWAGMRGIVTLATALAIPEGFGGDPFDRNLLIYLAFFVIVATLVGQGLSLPWFIRALGIRGDDPRSLAAFARAQTAQAGLDALQALEATFVTPTHWEVAGRMRESYERHVAIDGLIDSAEGTAKRAIARELGVTAIGAERAALEQLRQRGEIRDDVYRDLLWDLDLAESRYA